MIRISKKGDYAVFIMGFLAQRGAYPTLDKAQETGLQMLFSAQEISAQTRLQRPYENTRIRQLPVSRKRAGPGSRQRDLR